MLRLREYVRMTCDKIGAVSEEAECRRIDRVHGGGVGAVDKSADAATAQGLAAAADLAAAMVTAFLR